MKDIKKKGVKLLKNKFLLIKVYIHIYIYNIFNHNSFNYVLTVY